MTNARDHGGGLDAAMARFGGNRADCLGLPHPDGWDQLESAL